MAAKDQKRFYNFLTHETELPERRIGALGGAFSALCRPVRL
jgi:hypothetical protein